jgi:hypothetical protein
MRSTGRHLEAETAFALLGLTRDAADSEVRGSFRSLIRAVHPDTDSSRRGAEAANTETQRLLEAYHCALANLIESHKAPILDTEPQNADTEEPSEPASDGGDDTQQVWLIGHDTIAMRCTHEEAFVRVLEIGQQLGAITYLDRQGELLEVLLKTVQGDSVSLVISFQGRSHWVEAFLTAEVLDRAKHEIPTIEQLTELVLYRLATQWDVMGS